MELAGRTVGTEGGVPVGDGGAFGRRTRGVEAAHLGGALAGVGRVDHDAGAAQLVGGGNGSAVRRGVGWPSPG